MPTTRKRISVVLTPELEDALNRVSSVSGLPVATVARSFLSEAVPTINELAEVLEGRDRPDVITRWRGFVDRLEGRVRQLPREFPEE